MKRFLQTALCAAAVSLCVFKYSNLQEIILRNYVTSKVVKITNYEETTGGTGFFIQLPSGKTGILTNAHVCNISKEVPLYLKLDKGRKVPARIIEISRETDLCLLESYGTTKGLKVSEEAPEAGEKLFAAGHPALLPTTMTSGEMTGEGQIELIEHVIEDESKPECSGLNKRVADFQMLFFNLKVCLAKFDVVYTSVSGFPGSSGSPVVDSMGKLKGICFAGDPRINWIIMLPLENIKTFVGPY